MNAAYTEQDLREAQGFFTTGSSRTCLYCGHDAVANDIAEKELAAEFSRIRSEARAGMREACAKALCPYCVNFKAEYRDISGQGGWRWIHRINDEIKLCKANEIRTLPDLAARAALSGKEPEHD